MSGQFFNLNQIIGGYEEKKPSAATKKIIDSKPIEEKLVISELLAANPDPEFNINDYDNVLPLNTTKDYPDPIVQEPSLVDQVEKELEEYVKEKASDFITDAIGGLLIIGGGALLNPAGPEDLASPGPLDEILGITMIWAGRALIWL